MKTINFYKNNRFLGLIAGGNMLLVSVYKHSQTGKWNFAICTIAALFISLALFYPRVIGLLKRVIEWVVTKFTDVISIIVLFTLYFLVLTPMNLMRKITGKDEMRLKNMPDVPSYWQQCSDGNSKNLQQQF
jgi:hypothetical protein